MSTYEEGQQAIQQLNGKEFNGRNLTVNEAKPRTDRGGGFGGGGGGRRSGGGRDRDWGGRGGRGGNREPRW
jgi:RNA recognition motif-containing protein